MTQNHERLNHKWIVIRPHARFAQFYKAELLHCQTVVTGRRFLIAVVYCQQIDVKEDGSVAAGMDRFGVGATDARERRAVCAPSRKALTISISQSKEHV
jgi:hypothetical protein